MKTIRKNAREEIRVARTEYKGFDLINVRVWFEDRETGTMRPGKDGLAFRAGLVDEVIDALLDAKNGGAA
jgi:hypothetical protein